MYKKKVNFCGKNVFYTWYKWLLFSNFNISESTIIIENFLYFQIDHQSIDLKNSISLDLNEILCSFFFRKENKSLKL